MKKKLSLGKKILICFSFFIITLLIIILSSINLLSSKVERVNIDRTTVIDTGKEPAKEDKDLITIALLGTDYTESEDNGNIYGAADATMILGIDPQKKRLKLFSFMRDIYLDMPNGEKQNLNYTMAYGGPELILSTINYNFNLTVDKFIHVDLRTLPVIIDKLGGVDIEITDDEMSYINSYIKGIDKENGTTTSLLSYSGLQKLNGTQAAAYCRIRYTEGRDFKRTERQRTVLNSLFEKFKTSSITELISLMDEILPLVKTNLTNTEILSITTTVLSMGIPALEQSRFPLDGQSEMILTDMYHLTIDVSQTTNEIHKFLYSLE